MCFPGDLSFPAVRWPRRQDFGVWDIEHTPHLTCCVLLKLSNLSEIHLRILEVFAEVFVAMGSEVREQSGVDILCAG